MNVIVTARNGNEVTKGDIESLVLRLGGRPGDWNGVKLTVTPPVESERHPTSQREKLVRNLATDPNVVEVANEPAKKAKKGK